MNNHNNNTVQIQLSKGYTAIIDRIDADLAELTWHASEMTSGPYAHRWQCLPHRQKRTIAMHRLILERKLGRPIREGYHCDHINHNTLDNRRDNLREVTPTQNFHNARISRKNTSGYKGVSWNKNAQKWEAYIYIKRKRIHIGIYDNVQDAYRARLSKRKEYQIEPPQKGE